MTSYYYVNVEDFDFSYESFPALEEIDIIMKSGPTTLEQLKALKLTYNYPDGKGGKITAPLVVRFNNVVNTEIQYFKYDAQKKYKNISRDMYICYTKLEEKVHCKLNIQSLAILNFFKLLYIALNERIELSKRFFRFDIINSSKIYLETDEFTKINGLSIQDPLVPNMDTIKSMDVFFDKTFSILNVGLFISKVRSIKT